MPGGTPHVVFLSSAFPRGAEAGIDMVHALRARALARHVPVVAVVPTPWAPPGVHALHPRWRRYRSLPRHHTTGFAEERL